MNRAWLVRADARIARLEQAMPKEPQSEHQRIVGLAGEVEELGVQLDFVLERLRELEAALGRLADRAEALEARRKPGPKPKVTE